MTLATDERFLRTAIAAARRGIREGNSPFGACIVKGGVVVACGHSTVLTSGDITAHAEMNAIRAACKKLKAIRLSGCTMYSTTEPCPMCFSTCHWARVSRIVYGTTIADAKKAKFNELPISVHELCRHERKPISLSENVLVNETRALFREWAKRPGHKPY